MAPPLVVHHGGCRDGWCAAWVVNRAIPEAEFFAGYYGQFPPNAEGRDVVIVDFSYGIDEMRDIASVARSVKVLDHHRSARDALKAFDAKNAYVVFDMNRSGAGIAWDHYFAGKARPWLVDYVEDRDLWRHNLPHSEEINAYISVLPFDFATWDAAGLLDWSHYLAQGQSVLAKTRQYVAEVRKNARRISFEGHDVPIVNAPQVDISELLSSLCEGEKFAMGWWQRSDGVFQYSLRSRGGFDVSELAKRHQGGGHAAAAGFQSKFILEPT